MEVKVASKAPHAAQAYQKIIRSLIVYPMAIRSVEQARSLNGVGDKSAKKFDTLLKSVYGSDPQPPPPPTIVPTAPVRSGSGGGSGGGVPVIVDGVVHSIIPGTKPPKPNNKRKPSNPESGGGSGGGGGGGEDKPSPKKRVKPNAAAGGDGGGRKYTPKSRSGAWSILRAMGRMLLPGRSEPHDRDWCSKEEIVSLVQRYGECDESFESTAEHKYAAWSAMGYVQISADDWLWLY